MKVACCQFNPIWGNVQENMNVCNKMLEKYKQNDFDVLILPEMAFTGYVFKSLQEITPYLEDTETGPTVQWAKQQAVRLGCFVIVGYPQKTDQNNYNSICCVNPQGELVSTYQKTFLYETDENWAAEGPGFVSTDIAGLGKVGFGICMDLNPYQFKADFSDYEFANYHLNHNTELIFCSMAWLKSKNSGQDEDDSISSTTEYWAMRLLPLYRDAEDKRHTIFVACNRIGNERGSEFAGGSCVFDISNESIILLGHMKCTTDIMVVEL